MATEDEANRTLAAHADEIMENPNVMAISVIEDENGEKIIEISLAAPEIEVDDDAVKAESVRGYTPHIAPDELVIPDAATGTLKKGGATIRVLKRVSGKFHVQSFTGRQRPAKGGDSCGPAAGNWSGTLGARVSQKTTACILSNWHVLYGGAAKDGDPVLQPGRGDGGTYPADTIAYNLKGVLDQFVDAAIAEIRKPADDYVAEGTRCFGPITGVGVAVVNMKVKKCGRTTEATNGTVRSTNATVRVSGYPGGDRIFTDQILMTAMSQPGDSGSIVLDDNNEAVGLLFAGGDSDTIANKIQRVIAAFSVTF